MPRYEAYKDSGATWIGNVPSTWKVDRLKNHLKRTDVKNPGGVQVLSLYRELGIVPKDSRDDNHNVTSEDTSKYKYVQPGDFVVNKMKAWQGSVAVSDYEGIVSPAYYVYKFLDDRFHKRYFHYLIRSCYKEEFMRLSAGIRIGQWDLSSDDLDCVLVLLPTKEEQEAIADFLGKKVAHIDSLIAEAKASIEEYKAWKASIIYEAVTKGLDPNVEMKDSGVEWIAQVPTMVHVSRVGLHYEIILGKMLCPEPINHRYSLEPYFCAANVHFSGVDAADLKKMWFSPEEKEKYAVKRGDLLVVEGGAGAGGCSIYSLDGDGIYVQNSIMIVRSKGSVDNRYLKFLLESLVSRGYVDCVCNKATIPHFTKEKLSAVPFPVFSLAEQVRIAEYLDQKCNQIENLIAEKETLITDLESYKKALIFEVVTGKRRVC